MKIFGPFLSWVEAKIHVLKYNVIDLQIFNYKASRNKNLHEQYEALNSHCIRRVKIPNYEINCRFKVHRTIKMILVIVIHSNIECVEFFDEHQTQQKSHLHFQRWENLFKIIIKSLILRLPLTVIASLKIIQMMCQIWMDCIFCICNPIWLRKMTI